MTNVTISIYKSQVFHSWVAIFHLRPPMASLRYARAWSSIGCFILRATRLSNTLIEQGYSKSAWNHYWGSFMVDTGILSNNMKFPSHGCWVTFCSIYNDKPPPIRLYTKSWPYYWNRPFTESSEVSIEHLRRVGHADKGRSLVRTPGPVLFGTCICSTCCLNSFPGLVVIFPDYTLRISLGTSRLCPLQICFSTLPLANMQASNFRDKNYTPPLKKLHHTTSQKVT